MGWRGPADADAVAFHYAINDINVRQCVRAPTGTASVLITPPKD
ncbi:hypothetical protein AB0M95_33440 [Sphaerisporangium sp. NPDC051017]